ncbi:MAG: EexN family lipoprotein, partial [Candidatus Accumulibacter sp.]|nr:EexN family lipoprotein [Accumulibacter sp.]
MKRTNKVLLATIALAASFLIGCAEEVHTVDWYTEHKAER